MWYMWDPNEEDFILEEWWLELGLLYQMIYVVVSTVLFRCKFHLVWNLTHASAILCGFAETFCERTSEGDGSSTIKDSGKNSSGTTSTSAKEKSSANLQLLKLPYSFTRGLNIISWKIETAVSLEELISAWNITSNYWLKEYIYKRLPRSFPRVVKMFITRMVSALWHGLHPGYFLFFGSTILLDLTCRQTRQLVEFYNLRKIVNHEIAPKWLFTQLGIDLFDVVCRITVIVFFVINWCCVRLIQKHVY